ncbi:MAG: nicotinamide mononucleotide transporter [Ruminococcaceae bacterium]|nr:nicotinamide mononucleotide transporter [Oscillospiraceae bacterium]
MSRLFSSVVGSIKNLNRFERTLWTVSVIVIIVSFFAAGQPDVLVLCATLVGVTALVFVAKGDVLGQILCFIFSLLYAAVSFRFAYYGEMISYIGMSGVIALISTVSWIRHPYAEKQVKVNRLTRRCAFGVALLTVAVTVAFYFILKLLGTASLIVSTISIATSFSASALTVLRSPYYAVMYSLNDIVLITLWVIAAVSDPSSIPMIFCFVMFLINDLYGFYNWRRMEKQQKTKAIEDDADNIEKDR